MPTAPSRVTEEHENHDEETHYDTTDHTEKSIHTHEICAKVLTEQPVLESES